MRNFTLKTGLFLLLVLNVACSKYDEVDSWLNEPVSQADISTPQLGAPSPETIVNDPRSETADYEILGPSSLRHHFQGGGLRGTLTKSRESNQEGIIHIGADRLQVHPDSSRVTLLFEFNIPIDENIAFFQVVSGVDSIVRSVEFNNRYLLTEFYISDDFFGRNHHDFEFGMFFKSLTGEALPPANQILSDVQFFGGRVEATIADNFMLPKFIVRSLESQARRFQGLNLGPVPKDPLNFEGFYSITELIAMSAQNISFARLRRMAAKSSVGAIHTVDLNFIMGKN